MQLTGTAWTKGNIEAFFGIHELADTTEKVCDCALSSGFRPGVPGVWDRIGKRVSCHHISKIAY
jgi:hypothetical protein